MAIDGSGAERSWQVVRLWQSEASAAQTARRWKRRNAFYRTRGAADLSALPDFAPGNYDLQVEIVYDAHRVFDDRLARIHESLTALVVGQPVREIHPCFPQTSVLVPPAWFRAARA